MDELQRFVMAQAPVIGVVEAELKAGRKATHWMWFVFPQLAGLGHSPMARHYALASLEAAAAYLRHAVLGPRLRHCTGLVNAVEGRSVNEIFGTPDDMKFHSSMTLFARAVPDNGEFRTALAKYFDAREDDKTLTLLEPHFD
jgi:uncharacterized protein (DUF1810 family)